MNYFETFEVARKYATSRPYFHPEVVRRLRQRGITASRALDVGCGTGLSTRALTALAAHVTGIDLAAAMVALAPRQQNMECLVAAGERLPFAGRSFDLVTVSSVFHWLERAPFMAEAQRVLRPGSWLVAYDNSFTAEMREDSDFQPYFQAAYRQRFPAPPRAPVTFAGDEDGFALFAHDTYENDVRFTAEALVGYLMTQSNVTAAIQRGDAALASAEQWLCALVAPFFFDNAERTFVFRGPIWMLRRTG